MKITACVSTFQQFDSLSYKTIMHAMRNLLLRICHSNIDVTIYKINISVSDDFFLGSMIKSFEVGYFKIIQLHPLFMTRKRI